MAEMIVRSQCRSRLRQGAEVFLNVTFPLWGIFFPIIIVGLLISGLGNCQAGSVEHAVPLFMSSILLLFASLVCLFVKRSLSKDVMVLDKHGIRLPVLLGNTINLNTYVAWKDVASVKAILVNDELKRSSLSFTRNRGRNVNVSTSVLEPLFLEQILLAAHMWAPQLCDPSLASLQNVLRIGAKAEDQASFTSIWEEELQRRFCPTAYIALEPGRVLRNNSLKVINHLASGGLSSLYLCQLDDKTLVVLKEAVIPDDSSESIREKAEEMFQREAALLMKLNHPNVVRVLDCFVENGRNYMILEYVDGLDLRQLVKQNGPQSETQVLDWAISIASTMKHLHEREKPIIHRDLTPDNIVLRNNGQVIIVDFGAANEFIGNATGTFVGKHAFIAPEQLRGKATIQSDIYAFGCTLFYLLTGMEPEPLCPSNPKAFAPRVSDEFSDLVEMCTQLEAADRYQNTSQLIPILKGLAAQSVVL